jgi:hypothetical protein
VVNVPKDRVYPKNVFVQWRIEQRRDARYLVKAFYRLDEAERAYVASRGPTRVDIGPAIKAFEVLVTLELEPVPFVDDVFSRKFAFVF